MAVSAKCSSVTSSSWSFCWESWKTLGCFLRISPMQKIPVWKQKNTFLIIFIIARKSPLIVSGSKESRSCPTPCGLPCLNLPLCSFSPVDSRNFTWIHCLLLSFPWSYGAGANPRQARIKLNHLLVNTVIKPPSLPLPKRARFGTP